MSDDRRQTRAVAHRLFSTEFNQSTYTFRESEDEQAPIFALLPTGAAANRVFVVGKLTEAEDVGDDDPYWRARVADPVGSFFVYASHFQQSAMEKIRDAAPPEYVAVTGKPRTYETDSGSINVSLRPEAIAYVDAQTRRRWVVETADRTLSRINAFDDPSNQYAQMAREQYQLDPENFKKAAIEALESIADESATSN